MKQFKTLFYSQVVIKTAHTPFYNRRSLPSPTPTTPKPTLNHGDLRNLKDDRCEKTAHSLLSQQQLHLRAQQY